MALEVLAQDQLLEGDRGRLCEAQQHVALVGQEATVHRQAGEADDADAAIDPGNRGGHHVQPVPRPREGEDFTPTGGNHAIERQLQQAE